MGVSVGGIVFACVLDRIGGKGFVVDCSFVVLWVDCFLCGCLC